MRIILRILLMLVWYVLVGAGSYALIVYYLSIDTPLAIAPVYLMYGGYALIGISLVIAVLLLAGPARKTSFKATPQAGAGQNNMSDAQAAADDAVQPEQMPAVTEKEPYQQSLDLEPNPSATTDDGHGADGDAQSQASQTEEAIMDMQTPEEIPAQTANKAEAASERQQPSEGKGLAIDDLPDDDGGEEEAEDVRPDEPLFMEAAASDAAVPPTVADETPSVPEPAAETVAMAAARPVVAEPVPEVKMTETQQQFIAHSKASYLNTEGLPQFKITRQIDAKAIVAQENKRLDQEEQGEHHPAHAAGGRGQRLSTFLLIVIFIVILAVIGYFVYHMFLS